MIEAGLFSQITDTAGVSALVGDRVYPNMAPQEPTFPFIVYLRTATSRPTPHDGSAGVAFATIAVKCVDLEYKAVKELAEEVRLALDGVTSPIGTYTAMGIVIENEYDDPDPPQSGEEVPIFAVRMDVRIGYNEATS